MVIGIYRPSSSQRFSAGLATLLRFGIDLSTAQEALKHYCTVLDVNAIIPDFTKTQYETLKDSLSHAGVKSILLPFDMEYVEIFLKGTRTNHLYW